MNLEIIKGPDDKLSLPLTCRPEIVSTMASHGRNPSHLAIDPILNKYGALGMLIINPQPEKRQIDYVDPEWFGVGFDEQHLHLNYNNDPAREHHYVGTELGFSLIRYYPIFCHTAFCARQTHKRCFN